MKRLRSDYEVIDNLGDQGDPVLYGGYFVLVNRKTGDVGVEMLEPPCLCEPGGHWYAYRFDCEPHTYVDGVLSDNPYHLDYPVWYAKNIDRVAESAGMTGAELRALLLSDSPTDRAMGYRELVDYFGPYEFDQYPLDLGANRSRVEWRYRSRLARLRRLREGTTRTALMGLGLLGLGLLSGCTVGPAVDYVLGNPRPGHCVLESGQHDDGAAWARMICAPWDRDRGRG